MHELLTTADMAEADRLAISANIPSLTLMENAGRAVADTAAAMVPAGSQILILCGPGNNGGDGFVAARLLQNQGFSVSVLLLGSLENLKGDALHMAARWTGPTRETGRDTPAPNPSRTPGRTPSGHPAPTDLPTSIRRYAGWRHLGRAAQQSRRRPDGGGQTVLDFEDFRRSLAAVHFYNRFAQTLQSERRAIVGFGALDELGRAISDMFD